LERAENAESRSREAEDAAERERTRAGEVEIAAKTAARDYSAALAKAAEERQIWRARAEVLSETSAAALLADEAQRDAAQQMLSTASYLRCEANRAAAAFASAKSKQKQRQTEQVFTQKKRTERGRGKGVGRISSSIGAYATRARRAR
jgi:hypothetical protein